MSSSWSSIRVSSNAKSLESFKTFTTILHSWLKHFLYGWTRMIWALSMSKIATILNTPLPLNKYCQSKAYTQLQTVVLCLCCVYYLWVICMPLENSHLSKPCWSSGQFRTNAAIGCIFLLILIVLILLPCIYVISVRHSSTEGALKGVIVLKFLLSSVSCILPTIPGTGKENPTVILIKWNRA